MKTLPKFRKANDFEEQYILDNLEDKHFEFLNLYVVESEVYDIVYFIEALGGGFECTLGCREWMYDTIEKLLNKISEHI